MLFQMASLLEITKRSCAKYLTTLSRLQFNMILQKKFLSISSSRSACMILGIETSCDDTGAAIVDEKGNIVSEALHSQQQVHLRNGGIIPTVARNLHVANIKSVVNQCLQQSPIELEDLTAIATTVKPGLSLSLAIGMKYGKELCIKAKKPFIPIHHMEAHALTARMIEKIEFPFLVLLVSGGHCILAVVKNVDHFLQLGQTIDDAPGEACDKTARRLKLQNLPECKGMCGGEAIEHMAKRGDKEVFFFPPVMSHYRDCSFSFAGLKHTALKHTLKEEELNGIEGDGIIPQVADLCASFQHAIALHLCRRLQRAMEYVEIRGLISEKQRVLVVSGGVARNQYFKKTFDIVCQNMGYKLVCPPPKLCTDNGVMIAWNGMERWNAGIGIAKDLNEVDIQAKCPLGENLKQDVRDLSIKCKWIKLNL